MKEHWLDKVFEDEDRRRKDSSTNIEIAKDSMPVFWNRIGIELERLIKKTQDRRPELLEAGGFSMDLDKWTIRRLVAPRYEVEVRRGTVAVLVRHEFRTSHLIESDEVLEEKFELDHGTNPGKIATSAEGDARTIAEIAEYILKPLVTGERP